MKKITDLKHGDFVYILYPSYDIDIATFDKFNEGLSFDVILENGRTQTFRLRNKFSNVGERLVDAYDEFSEIVDCYANKDLMLMLLHNKIHALQSKIDRVNKSMNTILGLDAEKFKENQSLHYCYNHYIENCRECDFFEFNSFHKTDKYRPYTYDEWVKGSRSQLPVDEDGFANGIKI